MAEPDAGPLRGRRLLLVEDEYMIAADLALSLEHYGVEVVGPAGSVEDALALIEADRAIDAAVLDINLGGERVYPVAEALVRRGVPFVFATGYDAWAVPPAYAEAPRCEKPVDVGALARLLAGGLAAR